MRLPLLFAYAVALSSLATGVRADPAYSISTPDAVLTGMVTGSSVTIRLAAPSSALLARATLKLNGADVTSQVHADGAGSMSGVVAGLQPGGNAFQLWSKNSSEPVARPYKATVGVNTQDCTIRKWCGCVPAAAPRL